MTEQQTVQRAQTQIYIEQMRQQYAQPVNMNQYAADVANNGA